MVGASKILTVSYGTFSCTLEGFDEPFNTMKAIAEYFRDLAADDRYFGAEPPTPDAEMLHRIAEREIQRRVEAKINANGVVLRPQIDTAPKPEPEPMPEPAPEPVVQTPSPAAPAIEDPVTPVEHTPVAATVPPETMPAEPPAAAEMPQIIAPAPTANPVPESVAAKLQRIRAAVASARAAASAVPAYVEDDEILETEAPGTLPGPATETDFSAQSSAEAEDFGFSLDISGPLNAEDLEESVELPAEPPVPEVEDADDDMGFEPAAEAEAEEPNQAAVESEPETVEEPEADAEADRQAELAARRAARRAARTAALAAAAQELMTPEAAEDEAAQEVTVEAEATPAPVDPMPDDSEEPLMASVKAAMAQQEPAPEAAQPAAQTPETAAAEEAPPVQPRRPQIRARVIKVRRADPIIPAEADGDDEASAQPIAELDATDISEALAARLAAETGAEAEDEPAIETALSPEAEADLQAELAALEADSPTAPAPEDVPLDVADQAPVTTASQSEPDPEADLSRLMRQADEQLLGQENRRRFSAIAHLKAAVAATVADRRVQGGAKPADDTKAYRDDLSQAVRPRRPAAHQAHTQRPEVAPVRAAPLVLVSEQRVDRPADESLTSGAVVRPRRISTSQIAQDMAEDEIETPTPIAAGEAESFADFAESLGTQGLSDLLEAAAAYTAQVEGRPHFSPPQIMRKIAAMSEGAHVSREERLRVFGKLLRQGKITKIRRGQYAITEQSRFYSEGKRA